MGPKRLEIIQESKEINAVTVMEGEATSESLKKCPFCSEMIKEDAIVCRYCNRELLAGPQASAGITIKNPYAGKRLILLSSLIGIPSLLLAGYFWFSYLLENKDSDFVLGIVFSVLLIGSAIIGSWGKFQHWWHAE